VSKAKKPLKIPGCASCPWGVQKEKQFVEPFDDPEMAPNIILLVTQPLTQNELDTLQQVCDGLDITPVIVAAANCRNRYKPDLPVIKECREAYVNPLLLQYPTLPIVTIGEEAVSSLYGGVRKLEGKGGLLYKARMKDQHLVQHTYGISQWQFDEKREHARVVLETVLRPFQYELPDRKFIVPGLPMDQYLIELFQQPAIGLDIEIDVPKDARDRDEQFVYPYEGGKLAMLGLTDGTWFCLIPELHPSDHPGFYSLLKKLAAEYTGVIYGHNIKGDVVFLGAEGIEFPKATFHDTYLWHTTQPKRSRHSVGLKWLAKSMYGASAYEAKVHTEWDRGILSSQMPELIEPYLTLDLMYHYALFRDQQKEEHPSSSFQLAMDYLPAIRDTELNGIAVDPAALDNKIAELETYAAVKEKELQELAWRYKADFLHIATAQIKSKDPSKLPKKQADFVARFEEAGINVDSPQQMKALFHAMGFDVDATNEQVLGEIQDKCPAAKLLLEVKSTHKKLNTNCYEYRRKIWHPDGDGLIHAHYQVSGAETTRLRCKQPNMQNVEKPLRGLFTSRYIGGKLLVSDLSAIEYRIISHLSADPKLCQLFIDGVDIHRDAAARVFGIRPEQVTPEQRKIGKTFNFAGVYGAGPEKLFAVAGKEDWRLYHKVQNLYPGVSRWKEHVLQKLHSTGEIENPFGQWWEFDQAITPAIEREAINRIVQSAGHSILVIYRLAVQDEYKRLVWHRGLPLMVQEGHDAFIDDVAPKDDAIALAAVERVAGNLNGLIKAAFGVDMAVPITAEVAVLDRWE